MKKRKLIFVMIEEKKSDSTNSQYEFIGDETLIDKMELYFLERIQRKLGESIK